jgi:Ca2+-binding EF-hand superfamily protein
MCRSSTAIVLTIGALLALPTSAFAQDAPPPRQADDRQSEPGDRQDGPPSQRDRRDGPQFGQFRMPPLAVVEALDADKDGKLSADEVKAAAESLRKLDKNNDGKLSSDEIGWPPQRGGFGRGGGRGFGGPAGGRGGDQAPRGLAERMMKRDSNGDGKISRVELPRSMHGLFARADQNRDGAIEDSEAREIAKELGLTARPPGP